MAEYICESKQKSFLNGATAVTVIQMISQEHVRQFTREKCVCVNYSRYSQCSLGASIECELKQKHVRVKYAHSKVAYYNKNIGLR